ncbi:MAG TPA: hypothetical protein VG405_01375 [Solirubrobacteraceae bacterium]|nr:hypothetical protein [Solirubrobacteraceae bacterium]
MSALYLRRNAPFANRLSAWARRGAVLAGSTALALGVGACGLAKRINHPTSADAANVYVNSGPITYQVQISRALNPYSTEDAQYLAGIPKAQTIPPTQMWFAVFVWAKNQSGHPQTTSGQFTITDSSGRVYRAWPLNAQVNQYAWAPERLAADDTEPAPDTTASYGPTQGGLVLFRLSTAVYSNRPLTLNIYSPQQSKPTTVALDL